MEKSGICFSRFCGHPVKTCNSFTPFLRTYYGAFFCALQICSCFSLPQNQKVKRVMTQYLKWFHRVANWMLLSLMHLTTRLSSILASLLSEYFPNFHRTSCSIYPGSRVKIVIFLWDFELFFFLQNKSLPYVLFITNIELLSSFRHNNAYKATVLFHGMLGEETARLTLQGEGSYDGKHEVELAT